MLETFQAQLNQLGNRVLLTESLIGKLVNFFNIVITTNGKNSSRHGYKPELNLNFEHLVACRGDTKADANSKTPVKIGGERVQVEASSALANVNFGICQLE